MSDRVSDERLREIADVGYCSDCGRWVDDEAKLIAAELIERRAAEKSCTAVPAPSQVDDLYDALKSFASTGKLVLLPKGTEIIQATTCWTEPTDDGWYWLEELGDDSPPQKVARHTYGVDLEGNDVQPTWRRWTIAGWVDLKGRVAPCVGRPRKRVENADSGR